jgi:hypothetical protein
MFDKKRKGGREEWEYNREGELIQSTLYIYTELSQ